MWINVDTLKQTKNTLLYRLYAIVIAFYVSFEYMRKQARSLFRKNLKCQQCIVNDQLSSQLIWDTIFH